MDSSANPNNTESNTKGNEDEGRTRPIDNSKGKRKGDIADDGDSANPCKPKKKLQTRSWVWDHFTRKDGDDDQCKCHYCKRFFGCSTKSGTSNLKKHLDCCKHYSAWKGRQSQNVINQEGNLQSGKVSEEVFREATNEMLVLGQLPLSFVESVAWKHICSKANLYKPHSRRTATRDIILMNVARKASLKDLVSANKRRVSLTTDIWTAQATGASYMVITVHFIDEYWRLRKFIIGFKYIADHKGATISRVLLECLAEWGIERIFTITVDNATANTSALRKFQRALQSQRADSLVLNGDFMHMRCCAHIINLIVKEGLHKLGNHVEAIRNGVLYVRSSTSRCDSFEQKVVTGKMTRGSLPLDVKTRWNSTYLMLTRAIKFKVAFDKMEAEDKLYNDHFLEVVDGEKRIGPPTTIDWREVERLVKFLGLFYTATLVVSASSTVCSYKCYGEIVTIEKNLLGMTHSYDKELREKAVEMREKFDKYWDGQKNINRMLIIASVFDPRQKMEFAKMCFEKLYGVDTSEAKEMYNSVYDVMKAMLKEYTVIFKGPNTQSSQSNPPSSTAARDTFACELAEDSNVEFERMDRSYKEMVNEIRVTDPKDELDIYLKAEVENPKTLPGMEWDVLSWWRLNSQKYPVLSEIARDVLAMQVSSVASESAFSTSGRLLEPSRAALLIIW